VNIDTDNQYAFTRALTGHVLDHRRECSKSTLALIAVAYRPFGQSCCGIGERPASLGTQPLGADLHWLLSDPNTERQSHVLHRESHVPDQI
jgi:hypothetical protein